MDKKGQVAPFKSRIANPRLLEKAVVMMVVDLVSPPNLNIVSRRAGTLSYLPPQCST